MSLSRRSFLKAIGIGAAGAAIPFEALQAATRSIDEAFRFSKFNPNQQYGNFIKANLTRQEIEDPIVREALSFLVKDLKKHIPPRYFHKVKFIARPFDFGRNVGIAWMYDPRPGRGNYYQGSHGTWRVDPKEGSLVWSRK